MAKTTGRVHVGSDGVARPCNAKTPESCPVGQAGGKHYDNIEEYEKTLENEEGIVKKSTRKRKTSKPTFEAPSKTFGEGYMGGGSWHGSKHGKIPEGKSLTQAIRGDIKQAIAAGYLPEASYSVSKEGYNTVQITMDPKVPDSELYEYKSVVGEKTTRKLKPKYDEALKKMKMIGDDYSYSNSNAAVDYFDSGHYTRTVIVDEHKRADKNKDSARNKFNTLMRKLRQSMSPEEIVRTPEFQQAERQLNGTRITYAETAARKNATYEVMNKGLLPSDDISRVWIEKRVSAESERKQDMISRQTQKMDADQRTSSRGWNYAPIKPKPSRRRRGR